MALKRINKVCEKIMKWNSTKAFWLAWINYVKLFRLDSSKTVKKFLVTKKIYARNVKRRNDNGNVQRKERQKKKKKTEPNMCAKENVQKAKEAMKNGRWRRALITTKT